MSTLSPLLSTGSPVDWWFVFKFNGATFPINSSQEPKPTLFGGIPIDYPDAFSLSYVYASSADASLQMGKGFIGTTLKDPVGATFNQIYNGACSYVVWNDQFNNHPIANRDTPWGHSKGVLAWDNTGAGVVMQVSTPSWPGSGNTHDPRTGDGNTLGCVHDDDSMLSQHFFALKLTPDDLAIVLRGLVNASVATNPKMTQIVSVTGPDNLKALADQLNTQSQSTSVIKQTLSTGVTFISKPSKLYAPPWQLVSAQLGSLPLRVASFWADPDKMNSTTATTPVTCWQPVLGKPGPVQIAISGTWQGKSIGLQGVESKDGNHAKIGVSQSNMKPICVFGDLNQQGQLSGSGAQCGRAQNGRGGTFYALQNQTLWKSLTDLLKGNSAPTQ
jgi:hypothetical protein